MMGFMDCPKCKRVVLPSHHGGMTYTKEGTLDRKGDRRPVKIEEVEETGQDHGWAAGFF